MFLADCFVPEERLLFSMDAFGQHYASSQRFDDQAPLCFLMEEAKSYYANIIMPYCRQVGATWSLRLHAKDQRNILLTVTGQTGGSNNYAAFSIGMAWAFEGYVPENSPVYRA